MEPSRKTRAQLVQENQSLRARVAELERHVPRDDERKYHHLFENLNDAAFLADVQTGEILETNRQAELLLGRTRDEIVGMHQSALHPPGETVKYKRKFVEHIKVGHTADYDGEVIRKDGTVVPVTISAGTLTVNGRPRILGLFRDITELRRIQEHLVHRLAIEAAVARASRAFISAEGADLGQVLEILGKAVSVNRAYIFKFRDNLERMDNTHEWCALHTEPQIHNLQGMDTAGFPWWMEKLARAEDILIGDVDALPAEATAEKEVLQAQNIRSLLVVPIHSPGAMLAGFMGFDDTEKPRQWTAEDTGALRMVAEMVGSHWARKRAEEALRLQSEIIGNMSEGVCLVRASDGVIVYTNPRFEEMFAYDPGEMVGKHISIVNAATERPAEETAKEIMDFLSKHGHWRGRIENVKKDGTRFWCYASDSTFDHPVHGKVYAAVHMDITERKRAEALLRRSREQLRRLAAHLQSAREEERALLAREIHDRVGHELTALKMDVTQLEKGIAETIAAKPELREKLKMMGDALDGTIRLVGGIAAELRPGLLDDFGIAAAVEWEVEQFQKRSGIRCRFSPPREHMELDRERATTVFRICQEMLNNIARHAEASSVNMSLRSVSDEVVLIVRDNGRGVTEDEINSSRSLGILGMRERALAFGGQVYIQGVAGGGTTVTARIPLDEHGQTNGRSPSTRELFHGETMP